MGQSSKEFAVSVGINCAIAAGLLFAFGLFRFELMYIRGVRKRPQRLPFSFWRWITISYRYTQADIIQLAGSDAAMYLKILSFGSELFFFLTLWCLIVVLPTNYSGTEVDRLLAMNSVSADSPFVYWVPPPTTAAPGSTEAASSPIKPPKIYENVPPAPAGLLWWHYAPGVPPLPNPEEYYQNSSWSSWGWRYNDKFQQLLWRYNREAVALRIQYLMTAKMGQESHTVLVRDIPAIVFGTIDHRIDTTFFKYAPDWLKEKVRKLAKFGLDSANKAMDATVGGVGRLIIHGESMQLPPGLANLPKTLSALPVNLSKQTLLAMGLDSPSAARQDQMRVGAAMQRKSSSGQEVFWDAKETALPVYGNILPRNAPQLAGPEPAEPLEHQIEVVHPGTAKAHEQEVTEMNAWLKCQLLLQSGLTPQEVVQQEFEALFPGEVEQVRLVKDTTTLDSLVGEYTKVKRQLEDLVDEYQGRRKRLLKVKRRTVNVVGAKYGMWGLRRFGPKPVQLDCLDFWPQRLMFLAEQIREQQRVAQTRPTPAAFVTFKSRRSQVIAATSMLHHDLQAWTVREAPQYEEVFWPNVSWRRWERKLRSFAVWGAFFTLALFYLIPISAVQSLIQASCPGLAPPWSLPVNKLEHVPFIRSIINLPVINGLLTSFLPSLILRVFLALLPTLLTFMNKVQGMVSTSSIEFGVVSEAVIGAALGLGRFCFGKLVRKFFIFQVLVCFFGNFIAGSLLNQVQQIIQDPSSIVQVLGNAAPQTAVFFMTYVLLLALSTKPWAFLRLVGLAIYYFRSAIATTARAKQRLWEEQDMDYGTEIPDHTFTILLGLAFCIVAPLITPICLLYFLVCTLIGKYQLVYVFSEKYQTGGKVWRQVFEQVLVSMLIFQLLMIGLCSLKTAPIQAGLLVPLLFLTVLFRQAAVGIFDKPQKVLSLRGAADLDKHDKVQGRLSCSSDACLRDHSAWPGGSTPCFNWYLAV
eukprot:jgi/Astpho2/1750/Aster-04171